MLIQSIKTSFFSRLVLFLLFPFFAFTNSVRYIHAKKHFWIVLFFTLFFSYTYIPIPNSDATRYEERFRSLDDYGLPQYLDDINNMYNGSGLYQDAYVYTIQLLVSPFTSDILVYRLVLGFIYFYTFLSLLRNILINKVIATNKFNWFILGLVFITSFTAGINGIRWYLALMVYLLGTYRYITTNNSKFIFLASLSVFIHFTFFYSVFFLFLFVTTKKFYSPKFMSFLVLGTFLFSSVLTSQLKSNIVLVGDAVQERSMGYIENESWKEQRISAFQTINWYVQVRRSAPSIYVLFALLITTYLSLNLRKSRTVVALQYFTLLSFVAAFLAGQLLVSTDNRFMTVSISVGFIYLYHLFNENSEHRMMKFLRISYIPIAILTMLVNMRADLYTVSPNLVFGNVFTEMFFRFDLSIQELIGL